MKKSFRAFCVVMITVLFAGSAATAYAFGADVICRENPFHDVPDDADFAPAVIWALATGVTNGTDETTFSPGAYCTRAQVVSFLWRAYGKPTPRTKNCVFRDVPANSYYYSAVLWAVEEGITTGTSAVTFSPNNRCTEAHIITFIWRAAGKPAADAGRTVAAAYPDGSFYKAAAAWAYRMGMIGDDYDFSASAPRSNVVSYLYAASGSPEVRISAGINGSESEEGDIILFGKYEQDGFSGNGEEAIEWLVLEKRADKMLLISRYCLDNRDYHSETQEVCWESCALRKWLNGDFYDRAFSAREKERIALTDLTNEGNASFNVSGGSKTKDKVFILSRSEAERCFGSEAARMAQGTDFAVAKGASVRQGNCWWWLRTPGYDRENALNVSYDGEIGIYGAYVYNCGQGSVRPCLWVSSSGGYESSAESGKTPPDAADEETALPTEEEALAGLVALKGTYYEGMPWTDDDYVVRQMPGYTYTAYGCAGFALIAQEAMYGSDFTVNEYHDLDEIHVGDVIRYGQHSVVVMSVSGDRITVAEGNFNSSIHWGREIKLNALAGSFRYRESVY